MSIEAVFPIRFQDVDAAGVLFFGRIYDYCHQAYEELWAAAGVDRAWIFSGADFLIPIAHSEADYKVPIRHGERVTVRVDVTHVGRASFHLAYRVVGPRGATDLRASARTIHAFVGREEMRPIPIPEKLRVFLLGHLVEKKLPHHAPK